MDKPFEEKTDSKESTIESEKEQAPVEEIPSGIMRLREEWQRAGLPILGDIAGEPEQQVVFPESEDGAPVGDYSLPEEEARVRLRLSKEAFDRLILCGELDSILVRTSEGVRRFLSVASLERFEVDSAIESKSESLPTVGKESIEALKQEIEELKLSNVKQLQQVKDMLLLELRNLKEQDRDLTSYIFELNQLLHEMLPKRKKRR